MESGSTLLCTTDQTVGAHERQATLTALQAALPLYASPAFWHAVADPALPLEILVKCVRMAVRQGDREGKARLIELVYQRTRLLNERWAYHVLASQPRSSQELRAMVNDVCADLYERMLRALLDPERLFWEENFLHCLAFERKHVYHAFMVREGWWQLSPSQKSSRVPRGLMVSLDQLVQQSNGQTHALDIEDQQAQAQLLAIEPGDVLSVVLYLPEKLKAVILLIFWEGHSEKEAARILGITDRAVRYRLRDAFHHLRELLTSEKEEYPHA